MNNLAKIFAICLVCFWIWGVGEIQAASAREKSGVQLLMALDISGSMRASDPLRLLPKAATIMVNLLDGADHLGILSFEDVTRVLLPCGALESGQRQKGVKALQGLAPRGLYTDLYTVLAEALKTFGSDASQPRALLLITDGQMDVDPKKGNSQAFVQRVHQEIIPAYVQAKIPIYTVAFTPQGDQELLKALAEATGGRFLLVTTAREVHLAFTWLYENLKRPQMAPLIGDRFVIDPTVQEAVLIASRAQEWRAIGLTSPKGEKLSQARHPKNVKWFAAPTFDMVTIYKPQPGFWTISGFAPGEGRVILMTDLKLTCPLMPEEIGSDEAPAVAAAIFDKGQPVMSTEFLENLEFTAELKFEAQAPVSRELQAPPVDQQDIWPPGTRVGWFPPLHQPGQAMVKVLARGKTFLREQNFAVQVSVPWYKAWLTPGNGRKPARLVCQPSPGRTPEKLWGWLSNYSPAGGVTTTFLTPPAGSELAYALQADSSGSHLVDLRLRGFASGGRPLFLQPGPWRLDLTASALDQKTPPTDAPGPATRLPKLSGVKVSLPKLQGRGLWVAAGVLGGAALLGLGFYFYRRRGWRLSSQEGRQVVARSSSSAEGSSEQLNLLLKAQVEALDKERLELKTMLEELRTQLDTVRTERAQLAQEMERLSKDSQKHVKLINELEKRLETAEGDAKSVQMEYMNLFARDAEEKKTMAKE